MSGPAVHQTKMGRRFIEHTVPELARKLARIADALERLAPPPTPNQGTTAPGKKR